MRALILLLISSAAFGQVTLNYTGAPMSGTLQSGTTASQFDFTQIGGTVLLAQPLVASGTQTVTPVSFSFGAYFDNTTQGLTSSFSFTTVNGTITAWDIHVDYDPGEATLMHMHLTNGGDTFQLDGFTQSCDFVPANCSFWNASNTVAGTWTDPVAIAALQKQLAMWKSASAFYEAHYLAWQAMAWKCQKMKGVC